VRSACPWFISKLIGKAPYDFRTRALDIGKSRVGEGIPAGLWPPGFKTLRRMESNKKKILNMSTFLILAAEQRRIFLISASLFFLRGHLTRGLLSHKSRPIPLRLRFDVGRGKKPALHIVKLRS
jgi:hypothetical protein